MDANRLLAAFCAALIFGNSAVAQFQSSLPPTDRASTAKRTANVPVSFTNNPNFAIPFDIAATASDVTEVQLHVSTNKGRNWQRYQSQNPSVKGFKFRATADGEYWFAVKTIGRGQDNRGPFQPELKVVVDRQKPKLNMQVLSSPNGQVTADWLAQDDNLLDASSFRIQYQNQDGEWEDVPFTKAAAQEKRSEWQGQTQWWLRKRGSEVAVRAEVFDRAENSTVVSKRISVDQNGSGFGDDKVAQDSFRSNVGNRGVDTPVGQSWEDLTAGIRKHFSPLLGDVQHTNNTFGAANPQSWADREPAVQDVVNGTDRFERQPISRPVAQATNQLRTQPVSQSNSRFDNFSRQEATFSQRNQNPAFEQPQQRQAPSGDRDQRTVPRRENPFANRQDQRQSDPAPNFDRRNSQRFQADRPERGLGNYQDSSRPSQQRQRNSWPATPNRTNPPVAQRSPIAPPTTAGDRMFRPRITASPNFELVYDLYGIQSNDPRKVELWFTRDEGRSWELFGTDADGRSPVEVRLRTEGLYGFQLIVDSGRGQAPQPPQRGDEPDVWVIVDWTKPTARIIQVEMPNGPNSREITIEWAAQDTALLADAPITLSYSGNPNGPWTPIARGIPNEGAFYWRVDRSLPERLYIQLEARDMAGNVTADVYDGTGGPTGRIRDVLPIVR